MIIEQKIYITIASAFGISHVAISIIGLTYFIAFMKSLSIFDLFN